MKLDKMENKISELIRDCSKKGWNGYGAEPINLSFVENTKMLILMLPDTDFEIGVDPSGDMCLMWYKNGREVFVITVHDDSIIYARLDSRIKGNEKFTGEIPKNILDIIKELSNR